MTSRDDLEPHFAGTYWVTTPEFLHEEPDIDWVAVNTQLLEPSPPCAQFSAAPRREAP